MVNYRARRRTAGSNPLSCNRLDCRRQSRRLRLSALLLPSANPSVPQACGRRCTTQVTVLQLHLLIIAGAFDQACRADLGSSSPPGASASARPARLQGHSSGSGLITHMITDIIFLQQAAVETAAIGRLQALLTDGRQSVLCDFDICPGTAPSQGARKCTYERWFRKPSWAGASPMTLPLTHAAMQRFLRFRTGCHGLPKDVGSQSGVPRHQRVCQLCGTGFGDEMHLVFECAAMADLRGQFPHIFQPHQTKQQFMWQPNLLQVAKFLDAGMKRLQTVDPNEGSNI